MASRLTLTFEVAALPADEDEEGVAAGEPDIASLQINIRNLTEQEKTQFKIDSGVVVAQVADGVAAEAGVRSGDIIHKLNGQPVKDTKAFVAIARKLPVDKAVPMLISRRGQPMIVALRLEGKESPGKKKR
jgi:serine protease Do